MNLNHERISILTKSILPDKLRMNLNHERISILTKSILPDATARLASLPIVDGLYCAANTREQFERTIAGGVRAGNMTAVLPYEDFSQSMSRLAELDRLVAENSDIARIITSASEIRSAANDGVLGIIIGSQDATFLDHDVQLLRVMQRVGMRIMQPVYNEQNAFGSGGLAKPQTGLTEKGFEWVSIMNQLRMLIDLSHAGYQTAAEVIQESKQPVIFSHSNARTLCDSPRNIPDNLIRAAAETGGTVGITLWPPLLGIKKRPTLDNFCDQVDYMVNLVGVDHVAFGSDLSEGTKTREKWLSLYGPNPIWPEVTGILEPWFTYDQKTTDGYEGMALTGRLLVALNARGYSDDDIEKIMSGNLQRVYAEVWGS